MFRMILVFLVVFALFFLGIHAFVKLAKKEKFKLTKVVGYAMICAMLTVAVLSGLVILF